MYLSFGRLFDINLQEPKQLLLELNGNSKILDTFFPRLKATNSFYCQNYISLHDSYPNLFLT